MFAAFRCLPLGGVLLAGQGPRAERENGPRCYTCHVVRIDGKTEGKQGGDGERFADQVEDPDATDHAAYLLGAPACSSHVNEEDAGGRGEESVGDPDTRPAAQEEPNQAQRGERGSQQTRALFNIWRKPSVFRCLV